MRTYSEKWHGYRAAPPIPKDIADEIGAAAKAGDKPRQHAAEQAYRDWLADQGWTEPSPEPAGWARDRERKEDA